MTARTSLLPTTIFYVLLIFAPGAVAQLSENSSTKPPVLFKADQLRNEQELGLVVATGNVEFSQGLRTLLANVVTYNRRDDIVTASGKVTLVEPDGQVIFADYAELTGDLRNGIIENMRGRLANDALIAAASARRSNQIRTIYRKAVYSPCRLCPNDPSSAPTWQLKAYQVVHDKKSQNVNYRDAFIEFFGIPTIYTPYLSHPGPGVDRRTGFLIPTYGIDNDLGSIVKVPYYFDIAPNMDATFTPIFMSKQGAVASGQFRHRLDRSKYVLRGSLAEPSGTGTRGNKIRGHMEGHILQEFNSAWRGGGKLNWVSDDLYLRRYNFSTVDTLENRIYAEGFFDQTYASANAYYFRGLRSGDVAGETPIIFPLLEYNYHGSPGIYGGVWKVDANTVALTRTNGAHTRRASLKTKWELPYASKKGEIYRFFSSLQTDAYWVNDVSEADAPNNTISGFSTRVFPQLGLDWRLPMARQHGRYVQTIEPVAALIVAPNGKNTDRIPNEDSLSFEFDDTNLFSENRFGGIDRVEGGPRVAYGFNSSIFDRDGSFSDVFIGQSYRIEKNDDFGRDTGLQDHFSDVVGRINIEPSSFINAIYRFRLDKDNYGLRRSELQTTLGIPKLRLGVDHLQVQRKDWDDVIDPDDKFEDREEIALNLTSQVTSKWKIGINTRRNLAKDSSLSHGAFLVYKNDCLELQTDYRRDFTRNKDVQPSDTIFLRLILKTLGEVNTSSAMTPSR